METGDFEVGPGQTPPILVDLTAPAPPATPGQQPVQQPTPGGPPATPTAARNRPQPPAQGTCRGTGPLFGTRLGATPLAGMSGLGEALPEVNPASGFYPTTQKGAAAVPESPSPSKGKSRSYVYTLRRNVEGNVHESTRTSFNRALLNNLSQEIRALQQDTLMDLVSLYLSTNYDDESAQEIRDTLDEDLSVEIMLDRFVRAEMPIREAVFILALFQLARAFTEN
jgi:hypothetical protein